MGNNFQQTVLSELQLLLRPLADAAQSDDLRRDLFHELGWDLDSVNGFPIGSLNTAISEFAAAYAGLQALIDAPPSGLKELADVLQTTEHVVRGILALSHVFEGAGTAGPQGIERLGQELLDYLSTEFLHVFHPVAFYLLYLLTVIDDLTPVPATDATGALVRVPLRRRGLRLGQIPKLLTNPVETLKAEYGLSNGITDPDGTADKLFPRLMFFLNSLGARATYGVDPALQVGFDFGAAGNQLAAHMLTAFFPLPDDGDTGTFGFGTGLALSSDIGVIVRPLGTFDTVQDVGNWEVTLHGVVQAEGVAIDSSGVQLPAGVSAGINTHVVLARLSELDSANKPLSFLVGSATGTRLEVGSFAVSVDTNLAPGALDYGFLVEVQRAAFVITSGDGDGFLQKVLPKELVTNFDLAFGWSKQGGLRFRGAAGIDTILPVHVSIGGVVDVDTIELSVRTDGSSIDLLTTATFTAHIGSAIDALAQRTGLTGHVTFPDGGGNLGPLNFDLGFQLPRGIGLDIHAGPVSGGGFIFLDPNIGRYAGAIELSVYEISVKAFALLDTRLPDGSRDFSLFVIISAEFVPIQLGFGFTLIGVGGLIAVNRSLNQEGLTSVVQSGSLEHVLFPRNPIADAPAIINDVSTIFPPTKGHYVFGPMAKLGWGTPTLIRAELGIVLELPGPRLAILGVVQMALPTSDSPLLAINMAIAGLLDFPKRLFSLDASLYDSVIAGYPISGDMAFRLAFGAQPNFALAIGGFNHSYQPPPNFPTLRRVSVDLGVHGNPSLTLQGYFALTSNTAQVGAAIDLNAQGYGIRLNGHLGFDAMFVFSPFSFEADFSASVSVKFHGVGLGVGLHGSISGPTPWKVHAEACVSVLWWDACLPVSITFGSDQRVELPPMDPWFGFTDQDDPSRNVIGLQTAIGDSHNWTGSFPAGVHPVASLTATATATNPPIDPVGQATLRQKVTPLNLQLTRFGVFKPVDHTLFHVESVTLNGSTQSRSAVKDKFAPALFKEMSGAEKLSSPPFVDFDAGFTIAPDNVAVGVTAPHEISYETVLVDEQNNTVRNPGPFVLTARQLRGMLTRSAAALGGVRRSGLERYVNPTAAVRTRFVQETFTIADSCSLLGNLGLTGGVAVSRVEAQLALDAHLLDHPADRGLFQVIASADALGI